MAITVRGTAIGVLASSSFGYLAFPGTAAAGDYAVLFAMHGATPTTPLGWRQVDAAASGTTTTKGGVFEKVLTAEDIAESSVGVGFGPNFHPSAGYGVIALAVFVGSSCAGFRTLVSSFGTTSSLTRTLTTGTTPHAGDYALYFSATTVIPPSPPPYATVSSGSGGSLQTTSAQAASSVLAGQILGGAGAVSDTFTFAPASADDYNVIFIVAQTVVSPLNLRASLVTVEGLSLGVPALRSSLVTVESLSEAYRNLRVSLFCIEALYPVPPGGTVSTQLFPGSLGSATAMPGLAFSFHKRPRFSTQFQQAASGVSVRNAMMQYPIWEFEASFEFLRADVTAEYQTMLGFYLARQGGFDTFLFKDADDYLVAGGALGTGDGVTTQFFFKRTMGGFAEKVGQVDNGLTINIYKNAVLQGSGYTVTLPNSVVFAVAPAVGVAITADFQFFFNCRFTEDVADFAKFAAQFWELQSLPFESVPQ